ncbi:MAG: O-antigen ligase family protein [Chitinophagaceae bacterium]|nr:O-antigen ligase family protein [Chitinophagaceae bacterium]
MLYVYKCMQGKLQNDWRSLIIFTLMIIMVGAIFYSRAILSASIVAFTVVSFFHSRPKQHIRNFFSSPLLWGMSLLFFLPLLSGLWSEDKTEWQLMMFIKAPLFLLPLGFAGPVTISKRQWEWLAYIFILWVVWASIGSMFHYVNNAATVNEGYLRAKTMITPLENDHVRFSWLVSIAILLMGSLYFQKREDEQYAYWLLIVVASWLIIFLHILAARTGLISFYIMLTGLLVWVIIKRSKYSIVLLAILIVLPFVAYKTLPTFHNRIQYFLYDFEYFKKTNYLPGANDAVRIISIKAGWNAMQQQPLTGAGFGDVISETKKYYNESYPQMIEADKIYPSSEFIMYGAGSGWPGLIVFIFAMTTPFFTKTKNKVVWWLLNITAAFSLLFDPGLEVQFGVFIYSFMVLWCWKWFSVKNSETV